MGYAPDFVQVAMAPLLKEIKRRGIRVVSNAGGVNPLACVQALQEAAKTAGVDDLKVAMVTGDDLMAKVGFDCFAKLYVNSRIYCIIIQLVFKNVFWIYKLFVL